LKEKRRTKQSGGTREKAEDNKGLNFLNVGKGVLGRDVRKTAGLRMASTGRNK